MSESTDKKPVNILVIDDQAGMRDMLSFGLTDRNYRVVTAASGEEGIEKFGRETFELVVCDIMMPGKDGQEVLETLKKMQPEVEVIMATGYATLESAVESMRKGAYDYVAKPFSLDQICLIFEKALDHRNLKKQVDHFERLNQMKSELLMNIRQELRAPLDAILSYTAIPTGLRTWEIGTRTKRGTQERRNACKTLTGTHRQKHRYTYRNIPTGLI